ncbi:hypothetical protein F5Y13DRAFT_161262 [Hypoxylon sp. FL1857]|nr:hypothetical protein F5Y13DRAFT_161262 [Hypoxylon sp. FL1857]
MHPPNRRLNERHWCLSNRLYSVIAHGTPAKEATRYIRIEDEPELSPRVVPRPDPNRPEPEPRPSRRRAPDFVTIFQRGTLEGYTLSRPDFNMGVPNFMRNRRRLCGSENGKPLDIVLAAKELLSATHVAIIAFLMGYSMNSRMAYNMRAYENSTYRRYRGDRGFVRETQPKRTIEFRQAAGTVDPDEVVAHGKIVVRLCEAVATKTPEELWKMILDLAQAETHPQWYDVFDLLVELDLVEEARVIQQQMANHRGIIIPDGDIESILPEPPTLLSRLRDALWPAQRQVNNRAPGYHTDEYGSLESLMLEMGTGGIPPAY